MSSIESPDSAVAIADATARLERRLRAGEATTTDPARCTSNVPRWWRDGIAAFAVFGDGLMSFPASEPAQFSRPVTLFSAEEMSVSAGGEFVPFAWVDGGVNVAVVHDRAPYPVAVVAPDGAGAGRRLASSLVAFLDALEPQTLCMLVSAAGRRRIELYGDRGVLIEQRGRIEPREFDSDNDVGAQVATFLSSAIQAGFRVASCPMRMRALIARFMNTVARARDVKPEIRAQRLLDNLRESEMIELSKPVDMEAFVDDIARFLERHGHGFDVTGRPPVKFARRFADWLLEHTSVEEVFADDAQMVDAFVVDRRVSTQTGQ